MATNDRETQLLRDAYAAGITNPTELANFMAQIGHESGGLNRLEESFRYTKGWTQISAVVQSSLREGPEALEAARLDALKGNPEPLAELMYGGRMGNDQPGDGYRYHGRGYIQLTGKDQYEAAGTALELDLVGQPDLAAQPENASRIATWYWLENVPAAARDNARAAGAAINGSNPPNGLADREARFERWQRDVTPELMDNLANGRLGEPVQTPPPQPEPQKPGSFQDIMQVMLPPSAAAGVLPHLTGHYGEQRSNGNHGGTDFNYIGGQNGVNLQHPAVHSPVSGTVTFSGGQYGTVKIRDAEGNSHEILHLNSRSVEEGQVISAGDAIGTMGGRGPGGPSQYAQHVHYQLRDPSGNLMSPEAFWDKGRGQDLGGGSGPVAYETVRENSRGEAVRHVQESLNTLGIRDASGRELVADGAFGARTGEAVRSFQQANGLTADGVVGPKTYEALDKALARQQTTPPVSYETVRENSRGDAVRYVQESLNTLGVRDARGQALVADGAFGARTGEAVRSFQQANGLTADGVVGAKTYEALDKALDAQQTRQSAHSAGVVGAPPLVDTLMAAARTGNSDHFRETLIAGLSSSTAGREFSMQGQQAAEAAEKAQQAAGPER